MSTIEEQLALEQAMIDRGATAYLRAQRNAEEHGRGADLDYATKLMSNFILPLVDALMAELSKPGVTKYGRAKSLLRRIAPEQAMFIALKGMFNSFTIDESVASTASRIGTMVEDQIRFARFQEMHANYYDEIIKDFKRKGTKDYRYMHRVLVAKANDQTDQWIAWTPMEKVDVGMRLLDIIMKETDLAEKYTIHTVKAGKKRLDVVIKPTASAQQWINDHEAMKQFMYPDRTPCVIPPDPWISLYQGGYYTPQLRQYTPMVKASGKLQRRYLNQKSMPKVIEAINTVQETAWQVNDKILTVIRAVWAQNLGIGMPRSDKFEVPPSPFPDRDKATFTEQENERFTDWKREAAEIYTKEKDRIAKSFQVTRILRLANDYAKYPSFWYVWYADFRGRLYTATAGFSPQGPDIAKGLLKFSEGKRLGARGLYWLRVHIANRFGYDKEHYDIRVKWTLEHEREILACADDPLSNRWWGDADKPYQFLAACIEYKEAMALGALHGYSAEDYVSHLPIGLDGSCNGLQNFSAMLRDPIGGAATNLIPNEKPSDIYTEVGRVAYRKLVGLGGEGMADIWIRYADTYGSTGSLPRGLTKRPVMTLPYGSTRQSCTNYIFLSVLDTDRKFFPGAFKASTWLTPIIWEAIGEVVVAARVAMDWLQKCAWAMAKANIPLVWKTADDFIIVQDTKKIESVQIRTQLLGEFKVRVGNVTNELDPYKQRSGVSPNFVHSQDACHLRETVRRGRAAGITSFAVIHDDFGTHACDTDTLHACLREAFVEMYEAFDPLAFFKAAQEARGGSLPPVPPKGTLDIRDVLKAPHFFG